MGKNNTALAAELLQNRFGKDWIGIAQALGLENLCSKAQQNVNLRFRQNPVQMFFCMLLYE